MNSKAILDLYATLQSIEVPVPAFEMFMLLIVLTFCLVFKTTRTGLMFGFLFVYRWAWIVFQDDLNKVHPMFLYFYYAFGAIVVILAAIKWMLTDEV